MDSISSFTHHSSAHWPSGRRGLGSKLAVRPKQMLRNARAPGLAGLAPILIRLRFIISGGKEKTTTTKSYRDAACLHIYTCEPVRLAVFNNHKKPNIAERDHMSFMQN